MGWRRTVLLLALVLTAGCGKLNVISDPGQVETIHGNQEHVVEFWHTYSDEETRLLEEDLLPAFHREHPEIRVKTVRQANNDEMKNTLIARASSKRGPDAVRMDIVWVPEFMQKGLLVPLDGFPGFNDIRDKLHHEAMDIGFYQNQYYSLPMNINTKIAIYNKELLKKAGLSEPPKTLEETFELARKHRFGIGIGGVDGWRTLPYIYSLGGTLTDEHYTRATGYLNGEKTVKAVERLLQLYKEGIIDTTILNGGSDIWGDVKGGKTLMTDEGPWFYSVFNGQALDNAVRSTVRVPMPYGNGPASIIGGENLVIMKGSKQPRDAWVFLKWMTGKEAQLVMAQTGLVPTNQGALQDLAYKEESYIHPYVEALKHAFVRPPVKSWTQIDEVYIRYMRKIFIGDLSVQDGLSQAAAEIDAILNES